ncbi:hypothetical protein [Natrinema pallidum]|uniref:Uncharacterized protein n=2 Tax=Natrinema pallidum TaxID=69527 RepID=L9YMW6_9EURY|nr:hypothetical protein [Natrinema pallidum]ELY74827.1 hypothetical protein C487_14284 [Natrinema pallidum DSM 3751]QCW04429.1 hypothetical protein FGF80_14830 [Natrinema pallidum]
MDATADELAGVVDLFGGLTRAELERALAEAAYRADGRTVEDAALAAAIDEAVESFALVRYAPDADGEALLVAGPTAFPTVPEHAEDVPHILDIEPRAPDREALGETARERVLEVADEAVAAGETERIKTMIDVSYDIEAWAPVDLTDERRRLEDALEE